MLVFRGLLGGCRVEAEVEGEAHKEDKVVVIVMMTMYNWNREGMVNLFKMSNGFWLI